MITLLRKIRKQLLSENRLTRYLIYAIGEIALVMIGILLALQVNNWNEKRKNSIYIEGLLKAVETDAIANIHLANDRFNRLANADSLTKLIVDGNLTKSDFLHNVSLQSTIVEGRSFRPATENIDRLLTMEESVPTEYEEVISSIKGLKAMLEEMNQDQAVLDETINEYHKYLVENFGPYMRDSISLAPRLAYWMTDDFKNKSDYVNTKRTAYMFKISIYRSISMWMISQLGIINANTTVTEIETSFDNLNMAAFSEIKCSDSISTVERAVRETHPIFNLSKNRVRLKIGYIDEPDSKALTIDLAPNSFRWTPPRFKTFNEDYTKFVEILDETGDDCTAKYYSRKNGYLIIE